MKITTQHFGQALWLDNDKSETGDDFLCSLVNAGDVVVEANAHVGFATIPLSKKVGDEGYVVAFESQSLLFNTLCGNLALNHINNVQPFLRAAGGNSGDILFVPPLDYGESTVFSEIGASRTLGYERDGYIYSRRVAVLAIDDLQLNIVHLIKIDTKGTEKEALLGAAGIIKHSKPILSVRFEKRHLQILEIIQSYKYQWRLRDQSGLNLICFPEGVEIPSDDCFVDLESSDDPAHQTAKEAVNVVYG